MALRDARFVIDVIKTDYAGWPTKGLGPGAEVMAAAERRMLDAAHAAQSPTDHYSAISDYLDAFNDGHLGLQSLVALEPRAEPSVTPLGPSEAEVLGAGVAPLDNPAPAGSTPLERAPFRERLDALGADRLPVEAIWSIEGDRYTVGVIRTDSGRVFDAVVLDTNAEGWRAGELKARFASGSGPDTYLGRYLAGDRSSHLVEPKPVADGQGLNLGRWGRWTRLHPPPGDPQALRRISPVWEFSVEPLPDGTLWVRLPNFAVENGNTVQQLIASNRELLEQSDRLVLDIRGNGGGSDSVYAPLLPFVVQGDVTSKGVEVRYTERNIAGFRDLANEVEASNAELASTIRTMVDGVVARAQGDADGFVSVHPEPESVAEVRPVPAPDGTPRAVAVLIDGAASSGEQFILDVRDAPNVTLFGHNNSAGVLDYSNVLEATLPSGRFALRWATTRSLRLPDEPVDNGGIAPDVRFGPGVEDPVMAAAEWLRNHP